VLTRLTLMKPTMPPSPHQAEPVELEDALGLGPYWTSLHLLEVMALLEPSY